jgi:hypothetical protein
LSANRIRRRLPWAIPVALLFAALAFPSGAQAVLWYDFNEPYVSATGPDVRVYDWSADNCGDSNAIPDQPARAFRNAAGQVVMLATHYEARRFTGSTLGALTHQCPMIWNSPESPDPSTWDHASWISAPYTRDGNVVYSLSHMEYRGWLFDPRQPPLCYPGSPDWHTCWYNAITLLHSFDGGANFSHTSAPTHYVGGPPFQYQPGIGPAGFFNPSNIVRGKDGYYYSLIQTMEKLPQEKGACLWRTQDLSDPKSWRAWNGSSFTVRFLDPYQNSIPDQSQHICEPVGATTIETGSESLTWNTYLKKWLLVRAAGGASGNPTGFYAYISDDLINWSVWERVLEAKLPWAHTCGEPDYVLYPSLLDPESDTRNFETTGQHPYLFMTHFNVQYNQGGCFMSNDRDLVRIPIELSNQEPGGPAAAMSASTTSPRAGEAVTFDASGSKDTDGSIVKHEWDLDGDGTYERNTGANPITETTYGKADKVTVTVRVTDNDGKGTDDTQLLRISGASGGSGGSGGSSSGSSAAKAGGAVPGVGSGASIARFRLLGKPQLRADGTIAIRVKAPAAGRVRVRAAGRRAPIRAASAVAAKARVLVVRVKPSARGRALLARGARLRFKAVVTFSPVGGATQSETRTVALRAQRG